MSLATLELLAHLDPDQIPNDLHAFEIDIPDAFAVTAVDVADLPADWQAPEHAACKQIGDEWLASGHTPLLRVPSASVPEEPNYIINPRHADAAAVVVVAARAFVFDPRLPK